MPDNVSALDLVLTGDPALIAIVRLSLLVSLSAVLFAALVGLPLGALVALVHRPASLLWAEYRDLAHIDGLSTFRSMILLFSLGRGSLLTAFLAAFGRAIAEVGAIIVVGGNIAGYTRTMTTAIALETSKGDLALALGLGLILLSLSVAVSTVAFLLVGRVGEK